MNTAKRYSDLPGLDEITDELCRPESLEVVYHRPKFNQPMPAVDVLVEIVERLKAMLYPGFFGDAEVTPETLRFHLGHNLDVVFRMLTEQIKRGHCFACSVDEKHIHDNESCMDCEERAKRLTMRFLSALPTIRQLLADDVQAAYIGDPAAKRPGETIFCYPSITALTHHRIAHELFRMEVELIPRIINEMAHSKTGIDIHPGAQIGNHFFIDHGTGVVIGETCVIGDWVKLYQGVTLGALSFPKDEQGNLVRGTKRHPTIEDHVVIYANATVLGGETIVGKDSVIGSSVWLTYSVEPGSTVMLEKPKLRVKEAKR
jgi:serine O-acetyltransferase